MDQPRGDDGRYISIEKFIMSIVDERFQALRREDALNRKALELQAREYERRLEDLNHAHSRAQTALNTFVSIEKYEEKMQVLDDARKIAVERLDEKLETVNSTLTGKLEDYITRYELRQREIDTAIATGEGAAAEAQRAAEEQGRKSNRNMAIVTIVLTIIIAVSQWIGVGAADPPPPTTTTPTVGTP